MSEKVLIIGGCGYIGSRLGPFLIEKGFEVDTIDLESFGNCYSLNNHIFDYSKLNETVYMGYSTIILLAGYPNPKACENKFIETFNNNVRNFVELLPKINPETKFIYASSIGVYGKVIKDIEINEEWTHFTPLSYYDVSKHVIDLYAESYNKVPHFGLRFGSVNGFSNNFRSDIVMNAMVKSATNNKVINVTNPESQKPILGFNDLCSAISRIIIQGSFKNRGIYNIVSFNSSVIDLAITISKEISSEIAIHTSLSNVYDARVSNKKFESTFDFKFTDTANSIIQELKSFPKAIINR